MQNANTNNIDCNYIQCNQLSNAIQNSKLQLNLEAVDAKNSKPEGQNPCNPRTPSQNFNAIQNSKPEGQKQLIPETQL